MQALDKYAPALLDAIDEQTAIFRATGRDADNPRWLIATPVTWNGDRPTVQLHSSQSWEKGGGITVRIASEHANAWGRDGEQYFRALKHAYLDALGISGGMPRAHRLRAADNTVGDVSADVAALIAARTSPPPPKAPKARKRTNRTASAKEAALAARIAAAKWPHLDKQAAAIEGWGQFGPVARTLRRAQLTLHRWAELECGTHAGHIERDGDDGNGRPYFVPDWRGRGPGGAVRRPIPDRERGALARVAAVCKASGLHFYHQTDPRGCALYVSAEPLTAENYSQRGIPCL